MFCLKLSRHRIIILSLPEDAISFLLLPLLYTSESKKKQKKINAEHKNTWSSEDKGNEDSSQSKIVVL